MITERQGVLKKHYIIQICLCMYIIQIHRPSLSLYALVGHLGLAFSLHRTILNVEGAFSLRLDVTELILETKYSPLVVISADLGSSRYSTSSSVLVLIRVSSVGKKITFACHKTECIFNYAKRVIEFNWTVCFVEPVGGGWWTRGTTGQREPSRITQQVVNKQTF